MPVGSVDTVYVCCLSNPLSVVVLSPNVEPITMVVAEPANVFVPILIFLGELPVGDAEPKFISNDVLFGCAVPTLKAGLVVAFIVPFK